MQPEESRKRLEAPVGAFQKNVTAGKTNTFFLNQSYLPQKICIKNWKNLYRCHSEKHLKIFWNQVKENKNVNIQQQDKKTA